MQKTIFRNGEGDSYFERNRGRVNEDLKAELINLEFTKGSVALEIGCGEGLDMPVELDRYGIDPSLKAVKAAEKNGVSAQVGTADCINHCSGVFDLVIFGFCLYLCDREDLYKIAAEADRVLKPGGLLVIHDFCEDVDRKYEHCQGVTSYKMDYTSMFWTYDMVRLRVHGEASTAVMQKPKEQIGCS